ncbi:bifunctional DNA primase/polymerase [Streptomyces fradiae]|uniref:bifunctional DNA primase/polymerase n=1 Tax=Streptomyces fradiae TaxID=1906 RepID=UPI0036FC9C3B
MSTWLREKTPLRPAPARARAHAPAPVEADLGTEAVTGIEERRTGLLRRLRDQAHHTSQVTAEGAEWLASASPDRAAMLARWEARPTAPAVLPCGTAFDAVNVPAIFGRRLLDRLWEEGPGSGPVAAHLGRMLLFTAPGTGQRLPALLRWEEWGEAVPPLLCHGTGDAVTIPPLAGAAEDGPRWVVAPDTRCPWLPGPEVVLWACVRVARATSAGDVRVSISPDPDRGANVYDVSRRR